MAKRRSRRDAELVGLVVQPEAEARDQTASANIEKLIDRVIKLSRLSPDDVVTLMETDRGAEIVDIQALGLGSDSSSALGSWESIKRASPAPLTDAQYQRFLQGLDPIVDEQQPAGEIEVYGAHLK